MLLMIPVWWNVIRHRRVFAGTGKMKTVVDIRNHINDAIQDMRYGYDTLPEDNLSKAAELLQGDDDVLVIPQRFRRRKICSWKCYENKDQTEAQIWDVDKICSNGFNYS